MAKKRSRSVDVAHELARIQRGLLTQAEDLQLTILSTVRSEARETNGTAPGNRIKHHCLRVLSASPKKLDVARVLMALNIQTDLEQLAQTAEEFASKGRSLPTLQVLPPEFAHLTELTMTMVQLGLDAFFELDVRLARHVQRLDRQADRYRRAVQAQAVTALARTSRQNRSVLSVLSMSRYLFHIACHARQIARDVTRLESGELPE